MAKTKLSGAQRKVMSAVWAWEGEKYRGLPVRSAGAYVSKPTLTGLERRGLVELRQVRAGKMPVYRVTSKGINALDGGQ